VGAWRGVLLVLLLLAARSAFAQSSPGEAHELALTLSRQSRWEEARTMLLRAHASWPKDTLLLIDLSGVYYRLGDRRAAITYARRALQLSPADSYGRNLLATLYLLDGRLDAAVRHWNAIGRPPLRRLVIPDDPGVEPALLRKALPPVDDPFLSLNALRASRIDVERLRVYGAYRLELVPAEDERFDLRFQAFEGGELHRGWLGRLLPMARSLPYQAVHVDFPNIRASAFRFDSLWRWDRNKKRALLSLEGPLFRDPRWRAELTSDLREEIWDVSGATSRNQFAKPFLMRREELSLRATRRVSSRLIAGAGLTYTQRRFPVTSEFHSDAAAPQPLEANALQDGHSGHLSGTLQYWAIHLPARRFHLWTTVTTDLGRFLNHGNYFRARMDWRAEWSPDEAGVWNVEAHLRGARSGGRLPFDHLFVMGMERDHDVWLRGRAATRRGRKGASPLARDYVVAQTHVARELYRHPAVRVGAGPFVDAGKGWDPGGPFGSRSVLVDAGIQANLHLLTGVKVSFVYGRNLRDGGGVFYTAVSRSP
jgi:hypothetical protein